ncbi:MAG: SUMF1/EgtB/PvdO family nonheme iron enzyme [Anaerolineales bacterium]|nr:SUMF1/EgtB/PvdO family nonheme iron enzyme [Anaerolineales bacterium]
MKRVVAFISLIVLTALILTACNVPVETTPTEPPQVTEEPLAATQAPVVASTETASSTLVTVDLAGPQMAVGSKYTYVDGTVLVAVPGGPFIMGYNFADNPEREISVGDFWIYSTKVTNAQYALCVQLGKCSPPKTEDSPTYGDARFIKFPVTGVTHAQATDYCSFVHGRLPTEAEWEKTARGPEGNLFPWGNGGPNCNLLNYKFCVSKTTWVNEYKDGISYYSAFDMSGNAREWVADWYSPTYNIESPEPDPLGPELGEKRSVRGSSYQDSADPSLSAHRFSLDPEETLPDLGFRCVVEDPTYFAPWCEQLIYVGEGLDGSQPDCAPIVECNDVSISQGLNCTENFTPYTIVTFNLSNTPPDNWDYQMPGCSQLPGEQTPIKDKFLCNPGDVGPASAQGGCLYGVPAFCEACPANYNKVDGKCVWDGSGTAGTACLPGSTYDPLTQCCSAIPGVGEDIGLCPAGTYPLNGACVDNPSAVPESVVQNILFDKCTPPVIITVTPGGGDDTPDDGCQPPPNGCGNQVFCSANCSCQSRTAPCP